jgi:hypothetical protein
MCAKSRKDEKNCEVYLQRKYLFFSVGKEGNIM